MIDLAELLENFADGKDVIVSMKSGEKYILCDFEMVDESMYDRADVCLAKISEVVNSKAIFTVGTKIEISILTICSLEDPKDGTCYFRE